MNLPMDFEVGLGLFMSSYTLTEQMYIAIPSRHCSDAINSIVRNLKSRGLTLSSDRMGSYTPPSGVGVHKYSRTECLQLPQNYQTDWGVLIIDDSIYRGGTLRAAHAALLKEGVESQNIWFLPGGIQRDLEFRMTFDRAQVFLDYVRSLR